MVDEEEGMSEGDADLNDDDDVADLMNDTDLL